MEADNKNLTSYLSFKLGEEVFAFNVGQMLNILEMVRITEVPKTPDFMRGVINLRGEVLPIIDTRLKFGMTKTEITQNTCILVMNVDNSEELMKIGALVDSVQEVLEISDNEIKRPPKISRKSKDSFIRGMVKVDDKFIIVLDINKVFSSEEIINLDKSAKKKMEEEMSVENSG